MDERPRHRYIPYGAVAWGAYQIPWSINSALYSLCNGARCQRGMMQPTLMRSPYKVRHGTRCVVRSWLVQLHIHDFHMKHNGRTEVLDAEVVQMRC
jgi:hypothetical protein